MKEKIKVKNKKYQKIIKVKISPNLIINIKQYELLSQKYKYGFLELNYVKKDKLVFVRPNGISLYDRLKKPINEYDFFFFVEQIVDITRKIEQIGLSRNNLVLDLKYVFLNESTKELSFIYLPIATPHISTDVLAFVEQIIYTVIPLETNSKYLSDFSFFVKKNGEFSTEKVEKYIYNINDNIVKIINNANFVENNNANRTKVENKLIDAESTKVINDELTELMPDDEQTELMCEDDESTCLFADESTELFLNDECAVNEISYKIPVLIRTLTEEVIRIDKPVFRIGKEENCVDYIVTNNIAVSRNHADIISRDGRYYVYDLRSKNRTYINNRVLPAEHEVEIFNGDVLKIANEEFLFQV